MDTQGRQTDREDAGEVEAKLAAISRSQAVIEFKLDGTILDANENFLRAMGYSAAEVIGRHHSMFVEPDYASSPDYRSFWDRLARGEFVSDKFKRVGKGGREIWIQASYNPLMGPDGRAYKVVKFAADVTEQEKGAETALFKSAAFDGAATAMMMVDRDFMVTYANDSTRALLRTHAAAFRAIWPNFDPEKIIGACIDIFHKNPAHQRQLLSDPSRLPYRTDITVGDLKFALNVSGVFDSKRRYVGNVLQWDDVSAARLNSGMLNALQRSQAIIEFDLTGKILNANEIFCRAMGYALNEIVGQHHSLFVEPEHRNSHEYRAFWDKLARGEFDAGKYLRIARGGKEIWIQASYNPILDGNGKPYKVVKFATDITEAELEANELRAKIEAIGRSQAVIEFKTDGTILAANQNFLNAMGYMESEIIGRHHSMFAEPAYAGSPEYRSFWERLNRGEFVADKFRRLGKGGKEIWIQASYNPLLDPKGRVFKVVKFAADITAIENERKRNEEERAAKAADQARVVDGLALGLKALSDGDLTSRLETPFSADYEQLRADFNAAMGKLQEAMKMIVLNAGGIRSGAGEISQAADDLSRRTEQQAASLEETAAALDEITATVRKTAEGATQANSVVAGARNDAEASGQVVREAVAAMSEIEKSARQISQIIGVIDEISFQTNLLALNAGVEAARAGDAGRGFAVVASEVRALAQRSSEAAKEIKGLISTSSQHVETGVDLVGQTGKALQLIVSKVGEINGLVSEIAASAQEQATGLAQVNTAINQMDQVTQQNAAMVEQSTAASHSLTQEAEELARLIARFDTGEVPVAQHHQREAPRRQQGSSQRGAPQRGQPVAAQPVAAQRQRVARFAAQGSAALRNENDDDWQEF